MKILLVLLSFGFLSCGTIEPTPKEKSEVKPYACIGYGVSTFYHYPSGEKFPRKIEYKNN